MKNGIYKTIKSYNGLSTLKDAKLKEAPDKFPYAVISSSSKCTGGSGTCAIITVTDPTTSNATCPAFMKGVNITPQKYWRTKEDGTNLITCIPGTSTTPSIINCTDNNKNPIPCCENVGPTDIGIIVPKKVSWNGVKSKTQISQAQCASSPQLHCVNGSYINGKCVCDRGWKGDGCEVWAPGRVQTCMIDNCPAQLGGCKSEACNELLDCIYDETKCTMKDCTQCYPYFIKDEECLTNALCAQNHGCIEQ